MEFFDVLARPDLLETIEVLLPEHRECLYPPTVTLSMFMHRVLEAGGSGQKAVNGWAAQCASFAPAGIATPANAVPWIGSVHWHARRVAITDLMIPSTGSTVCLRSA